jgi:RNA polymerase sigma-70 factor (ECF subfamily)
MLPPGPPTDETPDHELLARAGAGDAEAFGQLFRRRQGDVYRFALHMTASPAIAEDVTQEVFLAVMADARRYDAARAPVAAWLCGIARNLVRRRLDRDRLLEPLAEDELELVDDSAVAGDLLGDLTRAERIVALRQAVLTLPLRYREAIVLCDLQEKSYADAAAVLGCAIGTVRSRLHRARALLTVKMTAMDSADPRRRLSIQSASARAKRCFMNCHALTDAIVDLAREVDEPESAAAVQAHLAGVRRCAARFQRERMLTAGLRALSKSIADERPSNALSRRVLEQFAERLSVALAPALPGRRRLPGWLGAAAVLVAGVSGIVSGGRRVQPTWRRGDDDCGAGAAGTRRAGPPCGSSARGPLTDSSGGGKPAVTDGVIQPVGFVPLPGAASLPTFESGQIVRMELPVTSLPLYGVEILPDTRHNPVQADLLVGQDGQPRAIRLVRSSVSTGTVHP